MAANQKGIFYKKICFFLCQGTQCFYYSTITTPIIVTALLLIAQLLIIFNIKIESVVIYTHNAFTDKGANKRKGE